MNKEMPFRQVHLDFHTSEKIKNVGLKFSKAQFQQMLKLGNIGSITLCSKCHHGMNYHPTKIGTIHPHLKINLLARQIEACKEIGIKTPVYISAGFDEYYLQNNPGDMAINPADINPLHIGFKRLCFNTKYIDYLCSQIEEVINTFDCDGIFLDIVDIAPCVCRKCQQDMMQASMDPVNTNDVYTFASQIQKTYFKRTLACIRKNNPHMRLFQNAGHIYKGDRNFLKYVSHLELESLPTGGWGYDHFPSSAKYTACLGVDFLGMTGKFHTTWSEFGGFKHRNALRYETSMMLAFGAKCSIGDQLHPLGKMNEDTYRLVGSAYSEVKKKEPFCIGAKSVAEVALLAIESLEFSKTRLNPSHDRTKIADIGTMRILLERHVLFDVIDSEMDFGKYKVLIVPDERCLNDKIADKLQKFLRKGGKLMLSYQSGLKPDKDEFYFNIGKYVGQSGFTPEYLRLRNPLLKHDPTGNLIKSPFVIYSDSVNIETDAAIYADKIFPYFNRTLNHYCSHQHAPNDKKTKYPGVFIKGNICYFAQKLFTAYANTGQLLYRDLVYTILNNLVGGLLITTSLQSAGRISLMEQKQLNRYILHLLYAAPIKRGGNVMPQFGIKDIEVIEDILKLTDITCSMRIDRKIKRVVEALTGREISFVATGDRISFVVPEVDCHQMILLEY